MKQHVLDYAAAFEAGPEHVGGKGWNMARLDRYGFSVPAGGVLCAGCYRRLLAADPFRERLDYFARCTAEDAGNPEVVAALAMFADELRRNRFPRQ